MGRRGAARLDGREPVGVRQVKRSLREACSAAVQACSAAVRIAFWNALVLGAALLVAVAAGEVYLRAAWPFARNERPTEFVPGVGMRLKPHSEVRSTNTLDWWTVQRANSLGFLDREPPSPERAAASCHVAIVGDSFVEANQVPLSDKVPVRLEQMAAERLPDQDVTVAAYGHDGTAQVAQLPWWDEWIRHRPPKLVVLVFVGNDPEGNARRPRIGDPPYAHVRSAQDGSLELIRPGSRVSTPPYPHVPTSARLWRRIPFALRPHAGAWVRWRIAIWSENLPLYPAKVDSIPTLHWAATAFALDHWKVRVGSGGARLVVLASYETYDPPYSGIKGLAAERDIPVIDQMGHILAQGGEPRDVHFANDGHWSPQGHQWAAEALLEWMAANPSVCDR